MLENLLNQINNNLYIPLYYEKFKDIFRKYLGHFYNINSSE